MKDGSLIQQTLRIGSYFWLQTRKGSITDTSRLAFPSSDGAQDCFRTAHHLHHPRKEPGPGAWPGKSWTATGEWVGFGDMTYLSREIRDEIADELIHEHNGWVTYRDKQDPHPKGAVNIKRGVAEGNIKRLRRLIAILAPKKMVEKVKPEPKEPA